MHRTLRCLFSWSSTTRQSGTCWWSTGGALCALVSLRRTTPGRSSWCPLDRRPHGQWCESLCRSRSHFLPAGHIDRGVRLMITIIIRLKHLKSVFALIVFLLKLIRTNGRFLLYLIILYGLNTTAMVNGKNPKPIPKAKVVQNPVHILSSDLLS